MISNSLITQIITFALSLAIVFTFIQPTLAKIEERNEEIKILEGEKGTVGSVRERLNQLNQKRNSISAADSKRLNSYLPDKFDTIFVLRDIELLTKTNNLNLLVKSITPASIGAGGTPNELGLVQHDFSLSFAATYENLLNFLRVLEQNHYPLYVDSISIRPTESGALDVDMKLFTFSKHN